MNIPKIEDGLNKKIEKIKRKILLNSKVFNENQLQNFSKITYPNYWLLQSPEEIKFQIENLKLQIFNCRFKLNFKFQIAFQISNSNFFLQVQVQV